ncbi:MAG: Ig-like domain-containing protein [Gemmatimonadota bacterium]|nr:Ig-like domain-containing protein [Gemmatimonadota bacterium]
MPSRRFAPFAFVCVALLVAACTDRGPAAPPTPKLLTITVDTTRLLVGDSLTLRGTITLSNGATGTGAISWASSNPAAVTVSASGIAVAVANGSAIITGTSEQLSGTISLTVYDSKPVEQLKVVGSTATVTSTPAQIAAGQMTLVSAAPVSVGDILVGTQAGSYLRKVTAVSGTGTTQSLNTTTATLDDAFVDADLDVADEFSFAEALRAPVNQPALRASYSRGVSITPDGRINLNDVTFNLVNTVASGQASAKMTLSGSLGARFGSAARPGTESFDFKLRIKNARFKRLRAVSTLGFNFTGSVKTEISGNFASQIGFPRFEAPIIPSLVLTKGIDGVQCVFVGIVPVCYKVTIHFNAYAEPFANVTGTITQNVNVNYGITAGVDFNNGSWSTVADPFGGTTASQPNFNLGGSVGVQFGVVPELEVLLYGAAGPFVGLDANVALEAGLQNNGFNWFTLIDGGFSLVVGARAVVLGHTLAQYSNSIQLGNRFRIDGADGAAATATASPASASIGIGATQVLTPTVRSILGGLVLPAGTFSCTSSNTAVATTTGCTVRGVSAGTATITLASTAYPAVRTTVPITVTSGPLASVTPATLGVNHEFSLTACPQFINNITIRNTSTGPITWTAVSGNAGLTLESTLASGELATPNTSRSGTVHFNCASANSFVTDITFTVRNANGSVIQTFTVRVTVTVIIPQEQIASANQVELGPFVDPKAGQAGAFATG